MKVIILAVLLVGCAYAASVNEEEKVVEIIEAEHEDDHHDDDYHHNPRTRRPTRPNRKHEKPSQYNEQGYLVDYSMRCSSSPCYCSNVCMQWRPCNCVCPPPCPPPTTSTTTPEPEVSAGPVCDNGAPNEFFPDCCFNGGRGRFCCVNGADNLHCCLNGANNPWCSLPTQPPSQVPTPSPPGNDCNQCRCQPCIPWVPCPPCPCRQQCGCQGSSCGGCQGSSCGK